MAIYNLLQNRWIPCICSDGTSVNLSLLDILLNPANIREIVGDSPPVTIALHRLLLAILHRALGAPQDYDEWGHCWGERSWNKEGKVEAYLSRWNQEKRFDLFDDERPFYQSSYLKDYVKNGEIITLYFHNASTLFEHSNRFNAVLPAATAARMLISFQSFDVGGLKSYIDKSDKSADASPLIQSAVALVRGENLFETLMLNWHQYNESDEQPFKFRIANDLPCWERDDETKAGDRLPDGYVDLLTWQSRCVWLQPEFDESGNLIVRNAVVMKGFQFPDSFSRVGKETMVTFVKKDNKSAYLPLRFSENKSLWRNSLSILKTISEKQTRPKMFEWLKELSGEGLLDRSKQLPIDFYGLSSDQAKFLFWQHDRFYLSPEHFADNQLIKDIETALDFAEQMGGIVRFSISILVQKLRLDKTRVKDFSAIEIYWSNLESHFHKLLSSLTDDRVLAMQEWFSGADRLARQALDKTFNTLSGLATEQQAIVEAERTFGQTRASMLNKNSAFREFLPSYKLKEEVYERAEY